MFPPDMFPRGFIIHYSRTLFACERRAQRNDHESLYRRRLQGSRGTPDGPSRRGPRRATCRIRGRRAKRRSGCPAGATRCVDSRFAHARWHRPRCAPSHSPDPPKLFVLIFTNYPYPEYREECLAAGANLFLDKSAEFEKIPSILRELVQKEAKISPGTR